MNKIIRGSAMLRRSVIFAAVILPLAVHAQDPVQTDGVKYKTIFENDCVRVLDYKDLPGEKRISTSIRPLFFTLSPPSSDQ
jgi:hypothetical protein